MFQDRIFEGFIIDFFRISVSFKNWIKSETPVFNKSFRFGSIYCAKFHWELYGDFFFRFLFGTEVEGRGILVLPATLVPTRFFSTLVYFFSVFSWIFEVIFLVPAMIYTKSIEKKIFKINALILEYSKRPPHKHNRI